MIFNVFRGVSTIPDVDLYIGGVSESKTPDAVVGPTFGSIIGQQFSDLKRGDRFFYENTNMFTPNQLNAIKGQTLARMICNNFNITLIQPFVFITANFTK